MTTDNATPATPDEGVMRRIQKCLALAASSNPHEAASAMRQAQKLMAAYNVTEGMLHAAEVEVLPTESVRHVNPPRWELLLAQVVAHAFGARVLWRTGQGPKGAKGKGFYVLIGLKQNAQLIQFGFQVLQRQVLKARSEYVATLPSAWTRPVKAKKADTFCEYFITAVAEKVSAFALTDNQKLAIENAAKSRTSPDAPKCKVDGGDDDTAAALAGLNAGKHAYLNRPVTTGGSTKPKLEARA